MALALQGKRINESTDDEIREALRVGIMLIGIPAEKHGDAFAKMVLLNFLRKTFPFFRVDEVKLAFEFAVSGKTSPNITLYAGEIISARFVSEIIKAYVDLKKTSKLKIASTPSVTMNNTQRLTAISALLSDETKQKVKDLAEQKDNRIQRPKPPYYDLHQKWFKQFDLLHLSDKFRVDYDDEGKRLVGRWIKRYGKILNVELYFAEKFEQLLLSKERYPSI
jgi:hypothetical protein